MEETKPLTPIDVFNGILRLARESRQFQGSGRTSNPLLPHILTRHVCVRYTTKNWTPSSELISAGQKGYISMHICLVLSPAKEPAADFISGC